jgi:hypothetical protein
LIDSVLRKEKMDGDSGDKGTSFSVHLVLKLQKLTPKLYLRHIFFISVFVSSTKHDFSIYAFHPRTIIKRNHGMVYFEFLQFYLSQW